MTVPSVLPTDWKIVPLGELLKSAQSGFASGARDPNGVIQMRMNNVTTDGNIDWTTFIRVPASREQLDKYRLFPGDVLFNSTNSPELVGKSVTFDGYAEPVVFSNHFVRLRVDETRLDPWYLGRWLTKQWQRRVFQSVCTRWVNQAAVRKADLLSLKVPLPPVPEQKRIAAILAKADRLRRLRRTARDLSDTYLQSVFLEMFGDPVSNPMGWEVTSLGKVCSLIRDGVHKTPPYVSSGVPFITVKNIVTRRLDFRDTKFVSEEVHSELTKRVKPERGDILVSKDGTIGVPCVVETDREFSIFVSVALLKPRREIVDPDFLAQQIRSDAVQRQIREGTKGIAIRHLHLEDFARLTILLPPPARQQEFVHIVHQFERLRAQQREAERQAEHLFQTLLHRAFRGEL